MSPKRGPPMPPPPMSWARHSSAPITFLDPYFVVAFFLHRLMSLNVLLSIFSPQYMKGSDGWLLHAALNSKHLCVWVCRHHAKWWTPLLHGLPALPQAMLVLQRKKKFINFKSLLLNIYCITWTSYWKLICSIHTIVK